MIITWKSDPKGRRVAFVGADVFTRKSSHPEERRAGSLT